MNCFISSSTELRNSFHSNIRNILIRNNVKPIDIYDIPSGVNVISELEDKIKKCDLFLAIIINLSPNIFYEIGIAKALNKPIFLVISKELSIYPSFLMEFLYVKANPSDDDDIIEFPLKQFIKNLPKQKKKKPKFEKEINKKIILPNSWDRDLAYLRTNGNAKDLENYMGDILTSLRTTLKVVEQDKGVDFAIWLDEADPVFGNPILIEVKYGNITNEILDMGEQQILNYLFKTNGKAGLLLYLDKNGKRFPLGTSLNPLVIRMDLEDFLSEVDSKKSLVNVILNFRNNMAHGKGGY